MGTQGEPKRVLLGERGFQKINHLTSFWEGSNKLVSSFAKVGAWDREGEGLRAAESVYNETKVSK